MKPGVAGGLEPRSGPDRRGGKRLAQAGPFVFAEDGVGDEATEEGETAERLGSDLEGRTGSGGADGRGDESETDRDAEAAGTALGGVRSDRGP